MRMHLSLVIATVALLLLIPFIASSQERVQSQEDFEALRKAAEAGDANAQYELGKCYYLGNVVSLDYDLAYKWFRASADAGNAKGINGVGLCYRHGRGVIQNN